MSKIIPLLTIILIIAGSRSITDALPWRKAPAGTDRPVTHEPTAPVVAAEGWVVSEPNTQVTLSAEVAGRISKLSVRESDRVHRGDLLVQMDVQLQEAELAEARAHVAEVAADVRWQEREVERLSGLHRKGAISAEQLDRAIRDRDASRALRERTLAAARHAELTVTKARVIAPFDGIVLARSVEQGEYVQPGTPLLTVADPHQVQIEAEVDEFDARRIQLGARTRITTAGYRPVTLNGQVCQVAARLGRRSIRPQDPSRPLDTRILPVKIRYSEKDSLKLGERVEVQIDESPSALLTTLTQPLTQSTTSLGHSDSSKY